MGLLDFLGRDRVKGVIQKSQPSAGWSWFGASGSVPGGVQSAAPINHDPLNLLSLNVGIVAACSNRNAQSVASAQPKLYASRGKGKKFLPGVEARSLSKLEKKALAIVHKQVSFSEETVEIMTHPALDLLQKPCTEYDGHALMTMTEAYQGLLGYAVWHMDKVGARVESITLLPSEWLHPLVDVEGITKGWQMQQGTNKREFDADEVIAFKNYIPGASTRSSPAMMPTVGIYGCGWLEQCLPEATLLREINKYERATMENSGQFPLKITFKNGSLSPESRRGLIKQYMARFLGGHRNEPLVCDADSDAQPIAWSPRDLEYEKGKADCRLVVCNCAGVPIDLVDSRDSNRATSLTAFRSYAILTVEPKLRRYEDVLNHKLLPLFDGNLFFKFDSPVPVDEENERKEREILMKYGIVKKNEIRAELGMEALDDDEDGFPAASGGKDDGSGDNDEKSKGKDKKDRDA